MRPLYILLRIILPFAFSIFFKRRKTLNAQQTFNARSIFVSNHPSAFIDPLVVANFQKPILFFMTRSDVFKKWLQPVTWACHMVAIYRTEQDGKGSYDKNQDVFINIQKVFKRGKSLIMFGEGYTDDVFIRSLKPIKKGPTRIGFQAMEATNWELDIKMQPTAINYTSPRHFRSDAIVAFADPIHLKDYKEAYLENPSRTILEITKKIEEDIQDNLTYIQDKSKADFLEHLLIISRKGMNHTHHDNQYGLVERFEYSKKLAQRINAEYTEDSIEKEKWESLEKTTEEYFSALKKKKIKDNHVVNFERNGNKKGLLKRWMILIITLPLFLIGSINNAIPYFISKVVVEKIFKRKVFWSGVKMVLGGIIWALYNLPIFWLLPTYVYSEIDPDMAYGLKLTLSFFFYFLVIPVLFVIWHWWKTYLRRTFKMASIDKADLSSFAIKRKKVVESMQKIDV